MLDALARNRFSVAAALWFYIPESMEWRLVIVTPTVDHAGPMAAYTRLQRILASISPSQLTFTDVSLMSPLSQDYESMRAAISSPHRFGATTGNMHNVTFEDAYLYQW